MRESLSLILRHWVIFLASAVIILSSIVLMYRFAYSWDACNKGIVTKECLTSDYAKVSSAIFVTIVTVVGGVISWYTAYDRELDRFRFELFESLHKEFRKTHSFDLVMAALDKDDLAAREAEIAKIDDMLIDGFASFLEKVAISVQSRLLPPDLANYFLNTM